MSVEPHTDEWHILRKTRLGASDAPIIMGVSKWKTPYQLMLEKIGVMEVDSPTAIQQRGLDLEDKARDWFFKQTNILMKPQVVFCQTYDFMFASLDGMDETKTKILEIKCSGKVDHNTAKKGKVPKHYYPQLQHQLSVTRLPTTYYLSFDGQEGILLEVERDEKYIKQLIETEWDFYKSMLTFVDSNELNKYCCC